MYSYITLLYYSRYAFTDAIGRAGTASAAEGIIQGILRARRAADPRLDRIRYAVPRARLLRLALPLQRSAPAYRLLPRAAHRMGVHFDTKLVASELGLRRITEYTVMR